MPATDASAVPALCAARSQVVMTLDNWDDHQVQLQSFFGWKKSHIGHTRKNGNNSYNPFTPQQTQTLINVHELDYELYCYAKHLARSRTSAAKAAMAASKRIVRK